MLANDWIAIGSLVVIGIFTVLFWLLKNKDALREKEILAVQADIKVLEAKQTATELKIAGEHYTIGTIDQKFDKLETTFKEGFREMKAYLAEMLNNRVGDTTGSYMSERRRPKE